MRKELTYEQIIQFAWWDWFRFVGCCTQAALIAWIAFADQSMNQVREEQRRHDTVTSEVSKTETVTLLDKTPPENK